MDADTLMTLPIKTDVKSVEAREALAKMVTKLFQLWDLNTADQLVLLGLSLKSRAVLERYSNGGFLPKSKEMLTRVGWLMAIHKELRILYPYNQDICYSWVKRRNKAFNDTAPIDVMLEQGVIGFIKVARYLEHYANN